MEYRYEFILEFYNNIINNFSLYEYKFEYSFKAEHLWKDDFNIFGNYTFLRAIEEDTKVRKEKNELSVSFLGNQYLKSKECAIKYFQSVDTNDLKKELIRFEKNIDQLLQQTHAVGNFPLIIEFLQKDLLKLKNKISNDINEIIESIENKDLNYVEKIEWLGNQKELAELFIELKNKGFIKKFNNKTLKVCFTKSDTIQEYLKPNGDPPIYPKVYTGEYTPRFNSIKPKLK